MMKMEDCELGTESYLPTSGFPLYNKPPSTPTPLPTSKPSGLFGHSSSYPRTRLERYLVTLFVFVLTATILSLLVEHWRKISVATPTSFSKRYDVGSDTFDGHGE